MSLSYLTTRALKGRCFWRREGGKEKTGAAGKNKKKRKNLQLACKHHTATPFFLRNIKKK
jgi:hypothetical protein